VLTKSMSKRCLVTHFDRDFLPMVARSLFDDSDADDLADEVDEFDVENPEEYVCPSSAFVVYCS
jgi:hypothetical protein